MFWIPFSVVNFIVFCLVLGYFGEAWDGDTVSACTFVTIAGPVAWGIVLLIGAGYGFNWLGRQTHRLGAIFRRDGWRKLLSRKRPA